MCGSTGSGPVGGNGCVGLVAASERKPCKTDLSHEQWSLVEPVIASWKAAHPSLGGHQSRYAMREVVNALLHHGRTGCQWDLLPRDFPPAGAPSASAAWPLTCWGWNAVVVAAASAHENAVGIALLDRVAADTNAVEKALVDQVFKNAVVAHGQKVGIEVEVVERNPAQTRFVPQGERWAVERVYGILMLHRRLVRDCEHQPRSSASRVYWAMTAVISRRLTGVTRPAWHAA